MSRLPQMVQDELDMTGQGDDADLVRRCAELGRPLLEAAEQIAKVHQDKAHPYNRREDPRHVAAVAEMQRLYAKVYGTRRVGAA